MEQIEAGSISIGSRAIFSGTLHREVYHAAVCRTKVTVLIHDTDCDICQVLTIGSKSGTVCHQFQMMRLAGGMDCFFLYRFAGSIIGYNFQFARFIRNIHPHQAIATLQSKGVLTFQSTAFISSKFPLFAITLSVDEQFGTGIAGVNKNRSILPFPARPRPVRKDMQGICLLVP